MPYKNPEKMREYRRNYYLNYTKQGKKAPAHQMLTEDEKRERRKIANQQWAAKNIEKKRESSRQWGRKNKGRRLENLRKWREANRDKSNEGARKWQRKWRAENPEKAKEKERQRYLRTRKNNPEWQARMSENRRKREGRVDSGRRKGIVMPSEIRYARTRKGQRDARLRKTYGITLEEWRAMFEKQNGCCAICGISKDSFWHSLCVDHDHKTGRVRGLLCRRCNAALGNLQDSTDLLHKAIQYLQTTS